MKVHNEVINIRWKAEKEKREEKVTHSINWPGNEVIRASAFSSQRSCTYVVHVVICVCVCVCVCVCGTTWASTSWSRRVILRNVTLVRVCVCGRENQERQLVSVWAKTFTSGFWVVSSSKNAFPKKKKRKEKTTQSRQGRFMMFQWFTTLITSRTVRHTYYSQELLPSRLERSPSQEVTYVDQRKNTPLSLSDTLGEISFRCIVQYDTYLFQ